MASRSSPPKNAPGVDALVLERLLRDGWRFDAPSETVLKSAERLERLGLVTVSRQEYVVCADSEDDDFPPMDRDCSGRILLRDGLDEGGDEFRCPECERPVYPFIYNKRRHQELRSRVNQEGVTALIQSELEGIGNLRLIAPGVYRVEIDTGEVLVCIVELCRDPRFLSREHARMRPTIFVAIDSRNLQERFLPEPWLIRVSVADLVAGIVDLRDLLEESLDQGVPSALINASVPVYDKVVPAMVIEAPVATTRRPFMVEFTPERLTIENIVVATVRADMRLQAFGILWKRFLEDLSNGQPPDDFRVISLSDLANLIDDGSREEAMDELNVRRAINRLQQELMDGIRKELGLPIGREDVIQNLRADDGRRRRRSGYRINPHTVLPRAASSPA
ncbi:hypothetical protein SIID45300_02285 [Candidatus Magnetaquicoccaceae bacterium FCR-1]|uniref:Uncharacterized protein n=1 Tax=Candidatus Magnetaquiglobus chichijimensis TaxID=3141448 RepID=A0ABQ0CAP4_9PROT